MTIFTENGIVVRDYCEGQPEEAKNDRRDNKVRWELMPLSLLNEVAKVYTAGAEKYGENTWQDLENGYERYKAAAIRHIISYEEGEQADPETGLHPLAHAAWNLLAMLYFGLKRDTRNAK